MGKRMTKALLRLCDLEKHVLEQVIAGLRQDVNAHYRAENELRSTAKEIEETNRQLQSMLAGELKTIASLREEVAKARFERDQARVELKALAEENERLRKSPAGWVHIRDFDASGPQREVLGVHDTGAVRLLRFEGSNRFSAFSDYGSWHPTTTPLYVMEIPQIDDGKDEFNG